MQKFRISVGLDAFTLSHTCTYRLLCTSHKNTGHIVVSTAMVTPPLHNQRVDLVKVSFLPALSFQCSRSCGSGIQKRELRCGERDSQGGYVPSTAHSDALHTPRWDLWDRSLNLFKVAMLWGRSRFSADKLSSPTQVCGVPRPEVQKYSQAFGGSPAGLQQRSVPRAASGRPGQDQLWCCDPGLVPVSLATGTSAQALIIICLRERLVGLCAFQLPVFQLGSALTCGRKSCDM